MQCTIEHHPGFTVIAPLGRMTLVEAPAVGEAVSEVTAGGVRRIVLDLGAVDFLDSSGLGVLIRSWKNVRAAGGELRIAHVGPRVQLMLELTDMHRFFSVCENPETAFDTA